jgi:hypothetical protein
MWLTLLIIHVVEIAAIGVFLLVRRNNALESAVARQQEYINAISIIVANSDDKLKELDIQGAFEADDEVGTFFNNLREIQNIISEFNSSNK